MALSRQNAGAGRTRNVASPRGRAAPQQNDDSWMHRGRDGMEQAEREREQIEQRRAQRGNYSTWRFWMQEGDYADVIVLDHSISEVPFFYEHNLKDAQGKWTIHETCPKEFENCPLCEAQGDQSYYVMMLTVLDLREFTVGAGTQNERVVSHSRRLLPVKVGQMAEFIRLGEIAEQQHGTMRGMHILLHRPSGGQSTRIGQPTLMDNGQMFEMVTEDELVNEFGHDPVYSSQNPSQVVKEADQDITVVDYAAEFPRPSADDLRARYGLGHAAGSARESAGARGGYSAPRRTEPAQETGQDPDAQGEQEAAGDAQPAGGGGVSRSRRAAPTQQQAAPAGRSRTAPQGNAPASAGASTTRRAGTRTGGGRRAF